jgi:hypothetical protein
MTGLRARMASHGSGGTARVRGGEENHSCRRRLNTMKVLATHPVGKTLTCWPLIPDSRGSMYPPNPATFSSFMKTGRHSVDEGHISIPHAHTVCVDPDTHLVYFPLRISTAIRSCE